MPTITDLERTIRRPGRQNDLVELTRDAVPLAKAAVGTGSPDCGKNPSSDYAKAADGNFTQGAFGESVCSLRNGLPSLSYFRSYTPELVAWFNDFGTWGVARRQRRDRADRDHLQRLHPRTPRPVQGTRCHRSYQVAGLGGTEKNARCPGSNERNPGDNS